MRVKTNRHFCKIKPIFMVIACGFLCTPLIAQAQYFTDSSADFNDIEIDFSGHVKWYFASNIKRDNFNFLSQDSQIIGFDIDARARFSGFTNQGDEYGIGARLRIQKETGFRGTNTFVGACQTQACQSNENAIVGHLGRFFRLPTSSTSIPNREDVLFLQGQENNGVIADFEEIYVFLRTSYGDFEGGRTQGIGELFNISALSYSTLKASNSVLDLNARADVQTLNRPAGFSEKITYLSPRFLGDTVGFGVQIGASYALDAYACGVDYCVQRPRPSQTSFPERVDRQIISAPLSHIFEVGIAIDRRWKFGLKTELALSFAHANLDENTSLQLGIVPKQFFTNLRQYNAGIELSYHKWRFSSSYLYSNNALSSQDVLQGTPQTMRMSSKSYTGFDSSLSYGEKNKGVGISLAYGRGRDAAQSFYTDQAVLSAKYDYGKVRISAGVKYGYYRDNIISQKPVSLFIEWGYFF